MSEDYDLKSGVSFGQYKLKHILDKSGGNGQVWLAVDHDDNKVAVKFLMKNSTTARRRFAQEIILLTQLKGSEGIVQILDYNLPKDNDCSRPYYAMPVYQKAYSALASRENKVILEAFLKLSKVTPVQNDSPRGCR